MLDVRSLEPQHHEMTSQVGLHLSKLPQLVSDTSNTCAWECRRAPVCAQSL